jgi:hypothetical protein
VRDEDVLNTLGRDEVLKAVTSHVQSMETIAAAREERSP